MKAKKKTDTLSPVATQYPWWNALVEMERIAREGELPWWPTLEVAVGIYQGQPETAYDLLGAALVEQVAWLTEQRRAAEGLEGALAERAKSMLKSLAGLEAEVTSSLNLWRIGRAKFFEKRALQ